ncbi:hypothetical protein E6H32_09020 [Candidatus Bathyarchaeota archaeon]|nr:MAG: hypothetical protein E6H32_09020 [Candidatus Bathyarchaeota archaeon]
MKRPEFLRGIYTASRLGMRPKTQISKIGMLKQVARAWGLDPDRIPTTEAQAYPQRTYASPIKGNEHNTLLITAALKDAVKKDIMQSV